MLPPQRPTFEAPFRKKPASEECIEFSPAEMVVLDSAKSGASFTGYEPEKWPYLSVDYERFPELKKYHPDKQTRKLAKRDEASNAMSEECAEKKQARRDHCYEHVNLFELPAFLAPAMCRHLIEQSEKMKFSDIKKEYDASYREADRVVVKCESLARMIWEKLRKCLKRRDVFEIMPYGFGSAGVWAPVGINPCFRFTRYSPGHHFKPHKDGLFVMTNDYRTIYTVVIYLNEDFEGGQTVFYETEPNQNVSDYESLSLKTMKEILPSIGKAVVFNHDTLHAAKEVLKGTKYILRTDILFQRISFTVVDTLHYLTNPLYHEAEEHYQKSIKLKKSGEAEESTREFLKGLEIQTRIVSIQARGEVKQKTNFKLPTDAWSLIFFNYTPFLSATPKVNESFYHSHIVSLLSVCSSWFYQLTDGAIWKRLYDLYFGLGDAERLDRVNEVTDMWFHQFKDRMLCDRHVNALVADLGNMTVKYLLTSSHEEHIIPSVFVTSTEHLWAAGSGLLFRMGWEVFMPPDYNCQLARTRAEYAGEIRRRYEDFRANGWQKYYEFRDGYGFIVGFVGNLPMDNGYKGIAYFLSELVRRFFDRPHNIKHVPLAIIRQYHYKNDEVARVDKLLKQHNVRSVTWLSPCVCVLAYYKKDTGLVIDIGSKNVTFGIAFKGEELLSYFDQHFDVMCSEMRRSLSTYLERFPMQHILDEDFNFRVYFNDKVTLEDENKRMAPHDFMPGLLEYLRRALHSLPGLGLSATDIESVVQNTYFVGGKTFYYQQQLMDALKDIPNIHFTLPVKEERIMCGVRGAKILMKGEVPPKSMLESATLMNGKENKPTKFPADRAMTKEEKKNCSLM